MAYTEPQSGTLSFLNKRQLTKLKMKAMRSGVWFRDLPRIDRVLVDLTIRVASCIRSITLAESILSVVRKLDGLLENGLLRAMREIGFPLAWKLSLLAQRWGNRGAEEWPKDMGFARYLAMMKLYGNRCNG